MNNDFFSRQRPVGITIIAALMLIFAVVGLCGSLVGLGFSPLAVFNGFDTFLHSATGALFGLILSIASLFLALGLFGLQRWAYYLTIVIEVLALLNGAAFGGIGVPRLLCGYHLIPIIVILYMLLDSNVRRAFRV